MKIEILVILFMLAILSYIGVQGFRKKITMEELFGISVFLIAWIITANVFSGMKK